MTKIIEILKNRYNKYIKNKNNRKYIYKILENKNYLNIIYDEITREFKSNKFIKDVKFDIKINNIKKYLMKNDFIIDNVKIISFIEFKIKDKENINSFENLKFSKEKESENYSCFFFKDNIKHILSLDKNEFYINNGFEIIKELEDKTNVIIVYKKNNNVIYNYKGDLCCYIINPLLIII